jgi:exopolyphosphatase/guanosine-5'-triphosphate,3'-diphosphate pyrophosphatase
MVRGLAALLRIADALDRTHFSVVKHLEVTLGQDHVVIGVDPGTENAELEVWAARRRSELLARLLDRSVDLRVRRLGERPERRPARLRLSAAR